ncbi:hypothetical protein SBI67_28520 [Mycolicibacterium sp. 120266]|uniref:hypothetical protein n=1 Tax=Mycolicibacterium sp. 120266 TaxID=3090601 RepID=UPI00299E9029|nr:hypothetical protein [Mycolicibacterium sp. 120266]MDX1876083.1 hypothetical protein [Mycolicibacterium sp. 120266]
MNQLRQAFQSGVATEVQVHGYTVIFDPGLPASGFSLASFGEVGFVIGPQGMASELELAHTIAHELYRVNMTEIPTLGVDAVRAASETASASDFAATVGPLIAGLGG